MRNNLPILGNIIARMRRDATEYFKLGKGATKPLAPRKGECYHRSCFARKKWVNPEPWPGIG